MDPKMIKAAKEIPQKLKEIMNSMFEASEPTLRSGVSALRHSLSSLDDYLKNVEREHLGSGTGMGRKPGRPAGSKNKMAGEAKPVRRRRRGVKRYKTGDFIQQYLSSRKEARPTEIAQALTAAAPGQHKSAISVVNTTLARMAGLKQVRKVGPGRWAAVSGASSASTGKKA